MTLARKSLVVGAGLAVFAASMAYWFAWREGAQTMRRAIEAWADDQRASGLVVIYDDVRAGGFPALVRGNIDSLSIGDGRSWRWSAATLRVDAALHEPGRLMLSATNPQALDLGRHGLWSLTARRGRVSFTDGAGGAWSLKLSAGPGAIARADGSATLRSDRLRFDIAPSDTSGRRIEARLEAENLHLRRSGEDWKMARLEADIATDEDGPAGREITVRRIHVEAEGASIVVEGAARVDAQGYLEGVLLAEIANPAGLASLLSSLGALRPEEAEVAAASLTLAAVASGGKLRAPIEMRGGVAQIAGVKIANLPRLD